MTHELAVRVSRFGPLHATSTDIFLKMLEPSTPARLSLTMKPKLAGMSSQVG